MFSFPPKKCHEALMLWHVEIFFDILFYIQNSHLRTIGSPENNWFSLYETNANACFFYVLIYSHSIIV